MPGQVLPRYPKVMTRAEKMPAARKDSKYPMRKVPQRQGTR